MKTNEKHMLDKGEEKLKTQPKYAENIIVLVQYMDSYRWFVTDKEIWFLDFKKLIAAYVEKGFHVPNPNDFSERFNIPVVNEDTAKAFLGNITNDEVEGEELKHILKQTTYQDTYIDISDMYPSLYVNFDHKQLISYYPEPASYELYVPDGWIGYYKNSVEDIPEKYWYWIVDGQNLFVQTE